MKSEIDKLRAVILRRWFIALSVLLVGLALIPFVVPIIPAYTAKAELLIVSEALKDPTLNDPNLPAIVTSTEVLTHVIKRLNLNMDPIELAKKVKTKSPIKSSILDLSYKDPNGDRAALILNTVADEAVIYYHKIATKGSGDVLTDLDQKIAAAQKRVAALDKSLHNASQKDPFGSSDAALNDLTNQYDLLRSQRDLASASLSADSATAAVLKNNLNHIGTIARGEILQKDPVYQQAQSVYAKDVADLVMEKAIFRDSFPGLRALVARTNSESKQLDSVGSAAVEAGAGLSTTYTQATIDADKAQAVVSGDRARLAAIDSQLVTEKKYVANIAGAGSNVGNLRSMHDAAVAQYMNLVQRLGTAQGDASQAAALGSLVVVSRAEPGHTTLPLWLAGLVFLVVALAIAAAYIAEAINPRLWGIREMEGVYRRPVFAEVRS